MCAVYVSLSPYELYHHGIKGQQWGRRRWQYKDGSLTPDGYAHYGYNSNRKRVNKYLYDDSSLTKEGKHKYKNAVKSPYYDKNRNLTDLGKKHYKDDIVLSKNTKTYRVALSKEDPVYDNKKYLSLDSEDNKRWSDTFSKGYNIKNIPNLNYVTMNDLKIAGDDTISKTFIEKTLKRTANDVYVKDLLSVYNMDKTDLNKLNDYDYTSKVPAMMVARQTQTGKQFIKDLQEAGYDGMKDVHGRTISVDPVVVFNPDKNLKKV